MQQFRDNAVIMGAAKLQTCEKFIQDKRTSLLTFQKFVAAVLVDVFIFVISFSKTKT